MRWLVWETDKIRLTKIDSETSVQMSWAYHKNYDYMNNMKFLTRKNIYKTVKVIIIDNYKIEPGFYRIDSLIISMSKTSGVKQVKQFFSEGLLLYLNGENCCVFGKHLTGNQNLFVSHRTIFTRESFLAQFPNKVHTFIDVNKPLGVFLLDVYKSETYTKVYISLLLLHY